MCSNQKHCSLYDTVSRIQKAKEAHNIQKNEEWGRNKRAKNGKNYETKLLRLWYFSTIYIRARKWVKERERIPHTIVSLLLLLLCFSTGWLLYCMLLPRATHFSPREFMLAAMLWLYESHDDSCMLNGFVVGSMVLYASVWMALLRLVRSLSL